MGSTLQEIELLEKGNFSNAGGYGIFCGKICVERKEREKAERLAREAEELALLEKASKTTGGMSTGALVGVTLASLAGVGLLIFAIKKMKK